MKANTPVEGTLWGELCADHSGEHLAQLWAQWSALTERLDAAIALSTLANAHRAERLTKLRSILACEARAVLDDVPEARVST
jgi:hypothetical protein